MTKLDDVNKIREGKGNPVCMQVHIDMYICMLNKISRGRG